MLKINHQQIHGNHFLRSVDTTLNTPPSRQSRQFHYVSASLEYFMLLALHMPRRLLKMPRGRPEFIVGRMPHQGAKMKKSLVVLSLLLVAPAAWSREFKENPDRVPSVGLNYSGTFLSGTGTFDPVPGFVFATENDLKDHLNQGIVDLRLPVSNHLTLTFGGGYVTRSVERIDASLLPVTGGILVVGDKLSDELSGPTFNVGARYYFN